MQSIVIQSVAALNVPALDQTLRAALGERFFGFTYEGSTLPLNLAADAAADHIKQARAIVQNHDPAQLTPDQQTAILAVARLDQARRDYAAAPLDLAAYQGRDALLEQLARKIVWLEQEVQSLRKGG